MYKGLIFDLDGTVLNTLTDLANAGNYALRELGYEEYPIECYKHFVGNGIPKLVERILPDGRGNPQYELAFGLLNDYYTIHKNDFTAPYDGVCEMLGRLSQKGLRLAVATNKPDRIAKEIVRFYFGDVFERVEGQREDRPKKPDPTVVNGIVKGFALERADVLYIGDSDVDMITASNAGLESCGVLWGFRDEDELRKNGAVYIAHSIKELEQIITGVSDEKN